ncbi:hypothetical protein ISN44_As10g000780 [Arabidopsis suecica]|uniref:Uncharacterized protein n=1 Tax=Arabidopsis suecica TaxID=45249 RepID=A0A8T1ZTN6_ARASU|nr:hypothetical protein ISN44_As10g000780 [Arabidopsis suecica]
MVVYLCLPSWNKVMAWEMSFLSYGSNVISRPRLFVFTYKRRNWIKSRDNRDKTVELLHKFARSNFPPVKYMEYAVQVETYTLSKANNLVLNVNKTLDLSLLGPSCPKWDVH